MHEGLVTGVGFTRTVLLGDRRNRVLQSRFVVAIGGVGALRSTAVVYLHRSGEIEEDCWRDS